MGTRARSSLGRIVPLARLLALLIGAIVGGQLYARGAGALPACLAGVGIGATLWLLLQLGLRRYRRLVESVEEEPPTPRRRRPRPSRRVLTDRNDTEP